SEDLGLGKTADPVMRSARKMTGRGPSTNARSDTGNGVREDVKSIFGSKCTAVSDETDISLREGKMACEQCGQPESEIANFGDKQLQLCQSCRNRYDLQDLLEHRILEVVDLTQRGNYQKAFDILELVLKENRHRDEDGWLEWSVTSRQAGILAREGRLSEALEKYRLLSAMRFPSRSEFLLNQVSLFDTLDALGDARSAIVELRRGLDAATGVAIPTALMALRGYARAAERDSTAVPVGYRALLKEVLDWWGIEVPNELLDAPNSLGPAILYAHDAHRRAALQ